MSGNIVIEWGQPILPEEAKLIGRVEAGELKPSEADAQRREAGLPPLAGWADPTGFDPRQRINWTLPMAISWIIWRTMDAVREEMPDYRRQSTFWNSRGEGTEASPTRWLLEHRKPRSVHDVITSAHAFDREQVVAAGSAEGALLRMLQDASSALAATGLPSPGAPRDRISAEEWEDLTPFNDNRHYDGAWAQNDSKPRWYEVRVKSADVMRLWDVLTLDTPIAEIVAAEVEPESQANRQERLITIAKGMPIRAGVR